MWGFSFYFRLLQQSKLRHRFFTEIKQEEDSKRLNTNIKVTSLAFISRLFPSIANYLVGLFERRV